MKAIRWFQAFRNTGSGMSDISQLKWEMSTLSGADRAAEWVSDTAEKDTVNLFFVNGILTKSYRLFGGKIRLRAGQAIGMLPVEIVLPEELDNSFSGEIMARVEPYRGWHLATPLGFLYEGHQITRYFTDDVWSERAIDGSLVVTTPSIDGEHTDHTECFVTGAPVALVVPEPSRGVRTRVRGADKEAKALQRLARALAKMSGLPIYTLSATNRTCSGLRRVG